MHNNKIKRSSSFTTVINSISGYDSSVFYKPLQLEGYIRDIYTGNPLVINDFIYVLSYLKDKIVTSLLVPSDIDNVILTGIKSDERKLIISDLFYAIYIEKTVEKIMVLEERINSVYDSSFKTSKSSFSNNISSLTYFKASPEKEIEIGSEVTFFWKYDICNENDRLIFSNGIEDMDVTHLDSICVSALFDYYVLSLYNASYKLIERKIIRMSYKKNVFCVNCGEKCSNEDTLSNYCIRCGVKLF